MKPEINHHYLLLKIAKQIWDLVVETYSEMGNTVKVYELKQSISQFQQRDLPLATYYYSLKEMWEEMNHYFTFRPKCKEDITAYAQHVEEFWIYELLASLNPKNEQLQVNILSKDPLISLNEMYAYLNREEKRRRAMT